MQRAPSANVYRCEQVLEKHTMIGHVQITLGGQAIGVPSACVCGRTIIVSGKYVKRATVHDEDYLEGPVIENPETFIAQLKGLGLRADIFSFSQRLPDVKPRHPYRMEWDNVAAIPLTCFEDWWKGQISHDVRKDVKRAEKRGVSVRLSPFDDQLVKGIMKIYNESPIRQGRPFWHFGKDFETVKAENATYLDRSDFLGAYCGSELVGFIKIVHVNELACMMQILAKVRHFERRPVNALIAKAVEHCCMKGSSYLTYGKAVYGRKMDSSLTEFKRRNGFKHISIPRYHIPLSLKGRMLLNLRIHRGGGELLPAPLISMLLAVRARLYQATVLKRYALRNPSS